MLRLLQIVFALMSCVIPLALHAGSVNYTLPEETVTFAPGDNRDVAEANCTGCHSADYIQTQPHGEKFKRNFWQAEVTKMIKTYGAPIDPADVDKIVDYLAADY